MSQSAIRTPIAAGRFYPASPRALEKEVRAWLASAPPVAYGETAYLSNSSPRLLGLMLPHAGYVYCGRVIGATLTGAWTGDAGLPRTLIILCPNHTGQGQLLGVWPQGAWITPLGPVPVDALMAAALCVNPEADDNGFAPDTLSHLGEHSIEVILPFLQCLAEGPPENLLIVPICVGTQRPDILRAAGVILATAIRQREQEGGRVGLIVSSDMNHYQDQEETLRKDHMALERALACDADGLLATVAGARISMCGAGPLALALYAAHALGRPWAELTLHETSAAASGDASHVVGYAGLRLGLH